MKQRGNGSSESRGLMSKLRVAADGTLIPRPGQLLKAHLGACRRRRWRRRSLRSAARLCHYSGGARGGTRSREATFPRKSTLTRAPGRLLGRDAATFMRQLAGEMLRHRREVHVYRPPIGKLIQRHRATAGGCR